MPRHRRHSRQWMQTPRLRRWPTRGWTRRRRTRRRRRRQRRHQKRSIQKKPVHQMALGRPWWSPARQSRSRMKPMPVSSAWCVVRSAIPQCQHGESYACRARRVRTRIPPTVVARKTRRSTMSAEPEPAVRTSSGCAGGFATGGDWVWGARPAMLDKRCDARACLFGSVSTRVGGARGGGGGVSGAGGVEWNGRSKLPGGRQARRNTLYQEEQQNTHQEGGERGRGRGCGIEYDELEEHREEIR